MTTYEDTKKETHQTDVHQATHEVRESDIQKSNVQSAEAPRPKQRRGFAAMDPAKQRAIASKGGKASHEKGTGHEWDSAAAREAGRKGGLVSRGGRGKLREGQ